MEWEICLMNESLTLDDIANVIEIVCENGGCPPDKDCTENQDCHKCLIEWLAYYRKPEPAE